MVFNMNAGGLGGDLYLDCQPAAILSDSYSGSAVSGAFNSGQFVHLGPHGPGHTGRNDVWEIGKWAFHDHALTLSERVSMYNAMMDTVLAAGFTDDFNRLTLADNWITGTGATLLDISSNEIRAAAGASVRYGKWVWDLGTPNMYGEIDVTNNGGANAQVSVALRNSATVQTSYVGEFFPNTNVFQIRRRNNGTYTSVLATATAAGSLPRRLRFETETVGSDVVLRLYEVISGTPTLRCTYTDLAAATPLLAPYIAGVEMKGATTVTEQRADNFACGRL